MDRYQRYKRRKKKGSFLGFVIFVVIVLVVVLAVMYATGRLNLPKLGGSNQSAEPSAGESSSGSQSGDVSGGGKPSASDRGASYGTIDGIPIKVHFVFVGQGDAIVIELPNGEYMVVDAGSGTSANETNKNRYYSYLDEVIEGTTIDYLVVTHPDSDHVNMMSKVVDDYEIKNFYFNEYAKGSKTYKTFVTKATEEEGASVNIIDTADNSEFDLNVGDCSLRLFSPGNDGFKGEHATVQNGMSIMILLSYGGRRLLLSGDAPSEEEKWFIEYTSDKNMDLDVDFLKVAHHGSQYSSSSEFLSYVKAEYAVICVDKENNSYNHPTDAALNRLSEADVTVYRTDTDGTIVLTIDSDGDYEFTFRK